MSAPDDAGENGRPLRRLLVYQMAKVASMSWVALGRQHFNVDETIHIHHLSDESLAFLTALVDEIGPAQTIARHMIVRELRRTGTRARGLLASPDTRSQPWLVVTGVRDPVARSVSLLFYFADFIGSTARKLSWRDGATVESLQHEFFEMWEGALGDCDPDDTFARLVRYFIKEYGSWFDREVGAVLGIDVLRAPFPPGPAARVLTQGQTRVLIYRVEDMRAGSPGHALLRDSVKSLCGAEVPDFPVNNATQGRRTQSIYGAFLEQLRMPAELLDRIYDNETARRFYLPEEINAFRKRWEGGVRS